MSEREIWLPPSMHQVNMGKGDSYSLVAYAQEVAVARGAAVIEALFHVAAVRSLPNKVSNNGAGANVTCTKAELNDTNASNTAVGSDGVDDVAQEAAHLVPGQICVNDEAVWQVLSHVDLPPDSTIDLHRLEVNTRMCFARTTILPAIFNRADSQGEGTSFKKRRLKWLFGEVAKKVWKDSEVDAKQPLLVDQRVLVPALQHYFQTCTGIYHQAAIAKGAAATRLSHAPGGETADAKKIRLAKQSEREDEKRILEVYADSYRVANPMRIVDSKLPWLRQRFL